MQFNNKIQICFNTYNEVGEAVPGTPTELKCCVLYQKAERDETDQGKATKYDLKIVVGYKAFAPYNKLMVDDSPTFVFDGKKYCPKVVSGIKDFSGKTKFFELELTQDKPA